MFRFGRLFSLAPVTPVPECTGEAADDQMKRALEQRGCIISEAVMLPTINKGWMHSFTFQRPRFGCARLFGYGKKLHICITAECRPAPCLVALTGPRRGAKIRLGSGRPVVTYKVSCIPQDGGRLQLWDCETLDELVRSL